MLETELATKTVTVVLSILNQVTGGALEEVGAQILQHLKGKLQGTFKLDKVKENPALLKATILDKVLEDKKFKEELEQLVIKFQKLEGASGSVNQHTDSGVNINATNSRVVGQQTFFRRP